MFVAFSVCHILVELITPKLQDEDEMGSAYKYFGGKY
jgi:hypothetical protein